MTAAQTTTPFVRRSFMLEPGEPLEIAARPLESLIRQEIFHETSGLQRDFIAFSSVGTMPLPVYPQMWENGRNRWEGAKAEFMWHPLMWLPERVASTYQIRDSDGVVQDEDPDTWAVRVGLELSASGLYDTDSGTWLDILAIYNLDVTDPAVLERLERWMEGSPDDLLDSIDTTDLFENTDDPEWALYAAQQNLPDLRIVSWADTADALLDACMDLAEAEPDDLDDAGQGTRVAISIATIGSMTFRSISAGESQWWEDVSAELAAFTGGLAELKSELLTAMLERLEGIHNLYFPQFEALAQVPAGTESSRPGGASEGARHALPNEPTLIQLGTEPPPTES